VCASAHWRHHAKLEEKRHSGSAAGRQSHGSTARGISLVCQCSVRAFTARAAPVRAVEAAAAAVLSSLFYRAIGTREPEGAASGAIVLAQCHTVLATCSSDTNSSSISSGD
jgi:hypothetical protein